MHRFFIDPSQADDKNIKIIGDDVAHISRVLRLRPNDKISACDQCGFDYECTITEISKEEVLAAIDEKTPSASESPLNITLYQGLPKSDKLELIIQKCTELGVNRIVPVVMKRTVVKLRENSSKDARYSKIALEAAKQSKRSKVPEVSKPMSYGDMLNEISSREALNILPYENEKSTTLKSVLKGGAPISDINIIIGSEGGFDDEEIALAEENNIKTVTLGPRILRCETAPIAAVAAVMYELGDW